MAYTMFHKLTAKEISPTKITDLFQLAWIQLQYNLPHHGQYPFDNAEKQYISLSAKQGEHKWR